MLRGKTVLLGVSASIAAYKAAMLASLLVKQHCNVQVLMTENAARFIAPLTFEELTGNRCIISSFDRSSPLHVAHIALAHDADLVMVAPASADLIAKLANGQADDMLTTTLLACKCPKLVAPAMNTAMLENPATQHNLSVLREYGYTIVPPAEGQLACGDIGAGKLPEPAVLLEYIMQALALPHDMKGLHVLVTAGPTQEAIDPVRYITNHSSGKMGYAVARMCRLRGAEVTLISGPVSLAPPTGVTLVPVVSAADMYEAVIARAPAADLIFKAAAVADYAPATVSDQKMKKKDEDLSIAVTRTRDILQQLGRDKRPGQVICGFSMETENMVENSRAKMVKKNLDIIAANNLKVDGAGFGTDTNVVTLITKDEIRDLPKLSKEDTALRIIDRAMAMRR